MSPEPVRVAGFGRLRAVAILAVLGIHTLMATRPLLPPTAPQRLLDGLLHFAVPVFVFVSGALVWGRPVDRYARFLRRRAAVVVVPYLAWSSAYLAVLAARGDPSAVLASAPRLLLTGETWYHLYFVPMLVVFYLLTPIAWRLARRSPEVLVSIALVVNLWLGPAILSVTYGAGMTSLGNVLTHLVVHVPEMALGAWFAIRREGSLRALARSWPLLLATGLGAQTATLLGGVPQLPWFAGRLLTLVAAEAVVLGLAGACFARRGSEPERPRALGTRIAALSFGAYLVHPLPVEALQRAVAAIGWTPLWPAWWFLAGAYAIIAGASFGVVALLAGGRRTRWLVGGRSGDGPVPTA